MKFSTAAVAEMANELALRIKQVIPTAEKIYGVPRGGVPVAMAMANHFNIVHDPVIADVIVDDLIDSGATRMRYPDKPFAALISKGNGGEQSRTFWHTELPLGVWVTFPWEGDELASADDIPRRLLQFIGEDPRRGGLLETPARFLKAWKHYTGGYAQDPAALLKTFEDGAERCDEMVLVRDIPVYSHCEHHLAPFFGVAHVAYIPNGKIVGLSKIARLVDAFARRLQVQERLTNQIADAIQTNLNPLGIGVIVACRHMCMEARGIQRQGSSTITSAMRGVFRSDTAARGELLKLAG